MLLGKRPRPPMRRTASMTGITLDLGPQEPSDEGLLHIGGPVEHNPNPPHHDHTNFMTVAAAMNGISYSYDHDNYLALVSPRRPNPHGTAHEFMETAQFLRVCGLCQRRLVPGRDIYMYRGETAFCSLECREQQMKKDERKAKRAPAVASVSK